MKTWNKLINDERGERSDETDMVHCTLSGKELNVEFDSSHGGHEGKPFLYWTEYRVYFPIVYDGAEWVGSAPRDPSDMADNEKIEHHGGE